MADLRSFWRLSVAFIGLVITIYGLNVELLVSDNPGYKPLCDISEEISCTKIFMSKLPKCRIRMIKSVYHIFLCLLLLTRYGTGFGVIEPILGKDSVLNIPNTIYGIVAYLLTIFLSLFTGSRLAAQLVFTISVLSCIVTFYLMYLLFLLKGICVVCISMYVVNFVLLYENFRHLNRFSEKLKAE